VAAIPTRLIEAVEKVKTQLETDISGSVVQVLLRDVDPEKLVEATDFPTSTKVLIVLLVGGDLDPAAARTRGTQQRFQRAAMELSGHVLDRDLTTAWKTFLNGRRQAMNALETVRKNFDFGSHQWAVDWANGDHDEQVPPPVQGFRIPFEIHVNE
jgi:hypothetical protein